MVSIYNSGSSDKVMNSKRTEEIVFKLEKVKAGSAVPRTNHAARERATPIPMLASEIDLWAHDEVDRSEKNKESFSRVLSGKHFIINKT